jgi:hypothetical protein
MNTPRASDFDNEATFILGVIKKFRGFDLGK